MVVINWYRVGLTRDRRWLFASGNHGFGTRSVQGLHLVEVSITTNSPRRTGETRGKSGSESP